MEIYRDPKTGRFCKKESGAVVISTSTSVESKEVIGKLSSTIESLEKKIQDLEKRLLFVEVGYDNVVDWDSEEILVEVTEHGHPFCKVFDTLPYNTVIEVSGSHVNIALRDVETERVIREDYFCDAVYCDSSSAYFRSFTARSNASKMILVPAFNKLRIAINQFNTGCVKRYACIGSKEMRRQCSDRK